MSVTSKFVYAATLVLCAALMPAHAARNSGWWVVLGSAETPDNNYSPQVESEVVRIERTARRCGLKPYHDFSSKFRGFTSGYMAVLVGAFASKTSADQVLMKAKKCLADAYVQEASYAGE